VPNSNKDDILLALYDCDYDSERAVALIIEKGHDLASEWRTATNHKVSKKQQQQKTTGSNRTGHEEETDENGQHQQQQRGNDGYNPRGKSRGGGGGRPRHSQQANGNESSNVNPQENENNTGQTRPRGAPAGGNSYRGRYRGQNRGGYRPNDRNYQQQQQQQGDDSNVDNSVPSDTTSRTYEGSYSNRRGGAGAGAGATGNRQHSSHQQQQHQQPDQWDVGNWNGETLIYSRTAKDEELASNAESMSSKTLTEIANGQSIPSAGSSMNPNMSERNAQQASSSEFDPVEAARQIKNAIGISHAKQVQSSSTNASQTKPLMDLKPLITDSSAGSSNKSKSSTGPVATNKVTPTPPPSSIPRIPHQPVVFTDRFNGGLSKIDVEFGNLDEGFDEKSASKHPVNVPVTSTFYPSNNSMASVSKLNNNSSSTNVSSNPTRLTNLTHHPSNEQTSFISPTGISNAPRPTEQLPVMNQQRLLPSQIPPTQPGSMAMKAVVSPVTYAVHQTQPQMNAPNMALRSLFYHPQQQQQEPVPLDTSYDPTAFSLPSTDFASPYFMATINPAGSQQQAQAHYLGPQTVPSAQAPPQGQVGNNRQSGSTTIPTSSVQTTSASTATSSSAATKKAPAVPPGIFIPPGAGPAQAAYSTGYSTAYGVPLSVGAQQQNAAASYPTLYETDHPFTNSFMQYANAQQAQSPSGMYGSVTPPVQQQGTHMSNDNKAVNYQGQQMAENLMLLQQYAIRQSNNQGQGQQGVAHSAAPMSYYLGHPSATGFSPVHPVVYAQAATPMAQQQQQQQQQQQPTNKQQGQHYNPSSGMNVADDYYSRNAASSTSSSSTKEGQYMYSNASGQAQQSTNQSAGQQSSGPNKQQGGQQQQQQQQQRANNNNYHNQSNPARSYQ